MDVAVAAVAGVDVAVVVDDDQVVHLDLSAFFVAVVVVAVVGVAVVAVISVADCPAGLGFVAAN